MPVESKKFPGFYRLDLENCVYLISRNGQVINELTGKIRKPVKSSKGYLFVDLRIGKPKSYHRFSIHRLVALLFVEKPDRHADKDFSELQVNHKNANKEDNRQLNLEWVTKEENIQHAQENSLYGSEKVVLARNIDTDEIVEFRSISKCAKWLCIPVSRLSVHLHSVCSGLIVKDDYVFKFKDNEPWPELISYDKDKTTLHRVADVMAENLETGERFLCNSLLHAIDFVGFTKHEVMNHRARRGHEIPYMGWIFYQFNRKR